MTNLFQKLIRFSCYLKLGGRLREFNFLKLNSKTLPTFHIDVPDESGKRHEFSFSFDGFDWKISGESIPGWIQDAGELFRKEISSMTETES